MDYGTLKTKSIRKITSGRIALILEKTNRMHQSRR